MSSSEEKKQHRKPKYYKIRFYPYFIEPTLNLNEYRLLKRNVITNQVDYIRTLLMTEDCANDFAHKLNMENGMVEENYIIGYED